jgi:hypothetical protein
MTGVVSVGVACITKVLPVPVWAATAVALPVDVMGPVRLAFVTTVTALPLLETPPVKVGIVVTFPAVREAAVPVAFVATSADGVPRAGVTSVGEVARTIAPEPVVPLERSEAAAVAPTVALPFASTVIFVYVPADTPDTARVVATAPAVVTSPVRSALVMVAAPENLVKFPVAGEPDVVMPVPVAHFIPVTCAESTTRFCPSMPTGRSTGTPEPVAVMRSPFAVTKDLRITSPEAETPRFVRAPLAVVAPVPP